MARIKTGKNVGKDREIGTLVHGSGNVKWFSCLGKLFGSSSKGLNTKLLHDSVVPFLGIIQREMKTYVHIKTCI